MAERDPEFSKSEEKKLSGILQNKYRDSAGEIRQFSREQARRNRLSALETEQVVKFGMLYYRILDITNDFRDDRAILVSYVVTYPEDGNPKPEFPIRYDEFENFTDALSKIAFGIYEEYISPNSKAVKTYKSIISNIQARFINS